MSVNVGQVDRIARFILGAVLIVWALGYLPGVAASPWGWIGLVPLGTSLVGNCPVYSLLGINTCGRRT